MPSLSAADIAEAEQLIEACSKLVKKVSGRPNTNGAAVAHRLLAAGCDDKAVLVSAALGDLPYTVHTLHAEVTPEFGKRAANAWHDFTMARVHAHREDCDLACDCDVTKNDCSHAHNAGCEEDPCVLKRLNAKAPSMPGASRAAIMAWFDFLTEKMAGCEAPCDWSRKDKAAYLAKMASVAASIEEKGKETIHTNLIDRMAKNVHRTVKKF